MLDGPRIDTDWAYRGVEAAILENEALRIVVLPGKGGDVIEFRDKRRDADVLFDPPFDWTPPSERRIPSEHPTTWQTDHYPGGWQVNLPVAGYGAEISGSRYGLHGESALRAWEPTVLQDDSDAVTLRLETELRRYPFRVERELTLPAGEPQFEVEETVTNLSELDLEYVWQQHLALGRPLVGPNCRLDVPANRGRVGDYGDGQRNARLASAEPFDWPDAPLDDGGELDLSTAFPDTDASIHDLAFATELEEGWYALTNPDLDLGFAFSFPTEPFEALWYWQAFGGYAEAPFYERNYNVGLEPTTAYPSGDLFDAQRENGTIDVLSGGEQKSASFVARTYTGAEGVDSMADDGTVETF